MPLPSRSFASLDEALTVGRLQMERVRFRFVVARLARSRVGGEIADRMMARLEAEVSRVSPREGVEPEMATLDYVRAYAAHAPEPYRTMLLLHAERFEGINEELSTGNVRGDSEDPLDPLAAEIGYRAARGALAGSIASELARFVRKRGLTSGPA